MSSIYSKLKEELSRRKKAKNPFQDIERKEESKTPGDIIANTLASFIEKSQEAALYLRQPYGKLHLKWLRKAKRFVSGALFFVYAASAVGAYPNPLSIVFTLTSLLMLDYMWKTRI